MLLPSGNAASRPPGGAIEISGLRKIYKQPREVAAVDGIDLVVRPGELFGILGRNGAGKTTTIQICTTQSKPTEGRVSIGGVDILLHPARARRCMGIVTQFNTLDRSLKVGETLYYHCLYFGLSPSAAKRRTKESLEEFHLEDRAHLFPAQLSGGLVQRVQVARALIHRPSVLFLDEPSSGLDAQTRLAMWDMIRGMRAVGVTVVLSTHQIQEAELLCERVAILDHGKVLACGTPSELKRMVDAESVFEVTMGQSDNRLDEKFERLPGVVEVQRTACGFRILARSHDGLLMKIVEAANGTVVRDIAVAEPGLESVLIKLTGSALRN